MYLVDTNVLSASAPTKAVPRQAVREWMDRNSAGLYLSAITVAEIEQGIACCFRTGAHVKAGHLTEWLETVLHLYSSRVLPVDVSTARRIGSLTDHVLGQGHAPGLADLALAATALHQGLVVLTQKSSSLQPIGCVSAESVRHAAQQRTPLTTGQSYASLLGRSGP